MDTTIGTSQTSLTNASIAINTLKTYYCARFVSAKLNQTSIAANTWTLSIAAQMSNTSARFPVASGTPIYLSLYVWRTSTQTKLGSIFDGATPNITYTAGTGERSVGTTVSGSAVSSVAANDDVIVFEVWFKVTQLISTSYTQTVYFDGTVENLTNNVAVSDHASLISTPETITFYTGPVTCTVTGKTVYNKTTRHG